MVPSKKRTTELYNVGKTTKNTHLGMVYATYQAGDLGNGLWHCLPTSGKY